MIDKCWLIKVNEYHFSVSTIEKDIRVKISLCIATQAVLK